MRSRMQSKALALRSRTRTAITSGLRCSHKGKVRFVDVLQTNPLRGQGPTPVRMSWLMDLSLPPRQTTMCRLEGTGRRVRENGAREVEILSDLCPLSLPTCTSHFVTENRAPFHGGLLRSSLDFHSGMSKAEGAPRSPPPALQRHKHRRPEGIALPCICFPAVCRPESGYCFGNAPPPPPPKHTTPPSSSGKIIQQPNEIFLVSWAIVGSIDSLRGNTNFFWVTRGSCLVFSFLSGTAPIDNFLKLNVTLPAPVDTASQTPPPPAPEHPHSPGCVCCCSRACQQMQSSLLDKRWGPVLSVTDSCAFCCCSPPPPPTTH